MRKIITISREFGAGGSAIGTEVAKRLGYEFYDKAIILRAAKESNIDVESILRWDEKVPANFGFAQSLFDFYNRPLNEKLFEVQKDVIRKIGEKGNCVIVGRNANTILKEFDNSLHVFVHAAPYWRIEHMKEISELDLPGYAIGGLAVGEPAEVMYHIIDQVEEHMPQNKPRYLMGVGTPVNILEAVYRGVDMFDCVMPSRNARHAHLFTWEGVRNIFNAKYALDTSPIDEKCDCPVCRNFDRAYLRHLFKSGEMLGMRLAVLHNLYFYNTMMEEIREAIMEVVLSICNAIRQVLNRTDPDLVADIKEEGLYLTGGGSLLNGFDKFISEYTGLNVIKLDDPVHSIVRGAAAALRKPELMKNVNYQLRSINELKIE